MTAKRELERQGFRVSTVVFDGIMVYMAAGLEVDLAALADSVRHAGYGATGIHIAIQSMLILTLFLIIKPAHPPLPLPPPSSPQRLT
jgi:hypothetical protein